MLPLDLQPIKLRLLKWDDQIWDLRCHYDALCLSACLHPSLHQQSHRANPACLLPKSYFSLCVWVRVCVCACACSVSPCRRLHCSPATGTDVCFPGQRWMYHSAVLSDLLWADCKCTDTTFWVTVSGRAGRLDDCVRFWEATSSVAWMRFCKEIRSDLALTLEPEMQEKKIWNSLLFVNMWRRVSLIWFILIRKG